ncbi:MAG: hypothetical protein WCZ18_11235 [Ottowia sp.]|nr:hypothetical protein [Ottowia sp.]
MPLETPRRAWHDDLRWRVGLLVLCVVLVVGGACTAWALRHLERASAQTAQQDARALAASVAQVAAQQLARALRFGIPLQELPGLPSYLQAALDGQPALAGMGIQLPDGATLHAVGRQAGATAPDVQVPIIDPGRAGGVQGGFVWVRTDARNGASLQRARWQAWLGLLLIALLAAAVAALSIGRRLERQRRLLWQHLAGQGAAPLQATQLGLSVAHGPLALLHALAQGEQTLRAQRQALDADAQELLSVDFDGQLRPRVERIRQQAQEV